MVGFVRCWVLRVSIKLELLGLTLNFPGIKIKLSGYSGKGFLSQGTVSRYQDTTSIAPSEASLYKKTSCEEVFLSSSVLGNVILEPSTDNNRNPFHNLIEAS